MLCQLARLASLFLFHTIGPRFGHVRLDRDALVADVSKERIEPDLVRAQAAAETTSPRSNERAQPGDVIGVESGDERSYLGDTSEDEDRRLESAERAARKS